MKLHCPLCGARLLSIEQAGWREENSCPYCGVKFSVDIEGELKEITWRENK